MLQAPVPLHSRCKSAVLIVRAGLPLLRDPAPSAGDVSLVAPPLYPVGFDLMNEHHPFCSGTMPPTPIFGRTPRHPERFKLGE